MLDITNKSPHNVNMKKQYIYGEERKCLMCGKSFTPRDKKSKSKYCSYSCNNKSRRVHKETNCKYCGEKFIPIRKGNVFCSKSCSGKYRSENHVIEKSVIINKKLAMFCCSLIHRSLRNKTDTTYNLLGYSADDLKVYLENKFKDGMSWDNYGNKKGCWSIDHIKPISKFDKDSTISEINALSNLQPLWHSENCSKRNKWKEQ